MEIRGVYLINKGPMWMRVFYSDQSGTTPDSQLKNKAVPPYTTLSLAVLEFELSIPMPYPKIINTMGKPSMLTSLHLF